MTSRRKWENNSGPILQRSETRVSLCFRRVMRLDHSICRVHQSRLIALVKHIAEALPADPTFVPLTATAKIIFNHTHSGSAEGR